MMLNNPKKRICPSCNCSTCWNIRRQAPGEMNGISPSMTSTRAQAVQKVSLSNARVPGYFFAGAARSLPPPRKALKNSEDDGSTTSTSLFLLKLAL